MNVKPSLKLMCACALMLIGVYAAPHRVWAYGDEPEVQSSTVPIGSPYYRHLASDFGIDLRELVKFERKGFGRSEIVTLILIADHTGKPLKDLGNRRIKDQVTLRDLAKEAGLDYPTLYKTSQDIKEDIESRGDKDLPPPVFEKTEREKEADEERAKKEEKEKKKKLKEQKKKEKEKSK